MGLVLITPPTAEPVTVDELKAHCRIEHDAENDLLANYIAEARNWIEAHTKRQIIRATWRLTSCGFPEIIKIPIAPFVGVVSIVYVDQNGDEQALAADQYQVDAAASPGTVRPAYGLSWPVARDQPNSVRVDFTAGWETPSAYGIENARAAVRILAGHAYENRELAITGRIVSEMPQSFDDLLVKLLWAPYD